MGGLSANAKKRGIKVANFDYLNLRILNPWES